MTRLKQKYFYLPNRWYGILESQKLGKKPKAIKRFGIPLVLFRTTDGEIGCFVDRCPHRSVELSTGEVVDNYLKCPYHGFKFDKNGICHEMPCEGLDAKIPTTMRADAWKVREKHGIIWLWYGAEPQKLGIDDFPDIPWFSDVNLENLYYSRLCSEWNSPFHRTLEAMFDTHHAPILHGKEGNILSKIRKAVDYQWHYDSDNEILELTGRLEEETTNIKARGVNFKVRMLFPGISFLEIEQYIKLYIVDSPIDEFSTYRIIHWLNDFWRIPLLGNLVIWLMRVLDFNKTQLQEDLPVVQTMERFSDWDIPERLVGADIGVAQSIRIQKMLMSQERQRANILPFCIRYQNGWVDAESLEKIHTD